ncbi:MAG: pilus assembly protein [Lentisphaerae bacterium]|nr:pilus assembly protein [Lentisphaerota bacterium]
MQRTANTRAGGQAMIEFIIGLVAMLALVAGLIQLVTLARTQLETMTEARRQAGRLALQSVGSPGTPDYIRYWDAGPDDRTYSRDDTFDLANASDFRRLFPDQAVANAADWSVMSAIPENPIADLHNGAPPEGVFGLVSSRVEEEVPLLPAVRHLLFSRDKVTVESKVWMTETAGFY